MKTKKLIILSISSDIAFEITKKFIQRKFEIIGTYRTYSNRIRKLRSAGIKLFRLDLSNKKKIDEVAHKIKQITNNNWEYFISAAGDLSPIKKMLKTKSDLWEKSIYINCLGQIRFLNKILTNKKKVNTKILFFAGSGTNGPKNNLSAYTLSKILLIKYIELLDSEEGLVTSSILGPGFLNTKIHKQKNFKIFNNFKPKIKTIIKFFDWFITQPKEVVGGRNFSLEYDPWNNKKINKILIKNKNLYKLRRFGNNLKI